MITTCHGRLRHGEGLRWTEVWRPGDELCLTQCGKSRKEGGLGTELGGWFLCVRPVPVLLADIYHHPEQQSVDSPHMFELYVIFLTGRFYGYFPGSRFLGMQFCFIHVS